MIGDVVGDFFFVCPCNYFATQYAEHGNKVFYYYFNHVSQIKLTNSFIYH